MNVWRRGSLLRNPYNRTAFAVAGVPPEEVRHRALVALIGQTRRVVSADPQAHVILGEPVTQAEINAAEQILLSPPQRIVEELLVHPTEMLPLDGVRAVARAAAEALAPVEAEPAPPTNLEALRPWAARLIEQYLAGVSGGSPSFGALELDLVPPFGRGGEE